jgi:hypothetical protein
MHERLLNILTVVLVDRKTNPFRHAILTIWVGGDIHLPSQVVERGTKATNKVTSH